MHGRFSVLQLCFNGYPRRYAALRAEYRPGTCHSLASCLSTRSPADIHRVLGTPQRRCSGREHRGETDNGDSAHAMHVTLVHDSALRFRPRRVCWAAEPAASSSRGPRALDATALWQGSCTRVAYAVPRSPRTWLRSTFAMKAISSPRQVTCVTCPEVTCSTRPTTRRGNWARTSRCRTKARSGRNSSRSVFAVGGGEDRGMFRFCCMRPTIRGGAVTHDGTGVRLGLEGG